MSCRVLLALSTSRYSAQLIAGALSEVTQMAEQGAVHFDVLYVTESDEIRDVSSRVGSDGFLGMSIQRDVIEALQAEHRRTALLRIEELKLAAEQANIPINVVEREGSFSAAVLSYAEDYPCDVIYLTRDDRPFISRFLFGSDADRVARLAKRDNLGRVVIDP